MVRATRVSEPSPVSFLLFCYVPKHTVGEQLLQVREAKREQAAYELTTPSDR